MKALGHARVCKLSRDVFSEILSQKTSVRQHDLSVKLIRPPTMHKRSRRGGLTVVVTSGRA